MVFARRGLNARQRELLLTVARARRTTLLRWPFYLKLVDEHGLPDRLGHPDLYGHEIPVDREDVFRLVELGLMQRLAEGELGFIDDYDVTPRGLAYEREFIFRTRVRGTAWIWIPLVVAVSLAIARM